MTLEDQRGPVPELPRNRPHLHQRNSAEHENYVSYRRGRSPDSLVRDRAVHATHLAASFTAALEAADRHAAVRVDEGGGESQQGLYLEFTLPPDSQPILQSLEDRGRHIELLRRKIEAYRDQETRRGKPKHELLMSRVESISLATVESFFTDDGRLPAYDEAIWWEVWVRPEFLNDTFTVMHSLGIRFQEKTIRFPERTVVLALASVDLLGQFVMRTEA